jgi:hypothetical protein
MDRAQIYALALLVVSCIGCEPRSDLSTYLPDQGGHRLVRISFSERQPTFAIRINEGPVESVRNASFTNVMSAFDFQYGDIVVWKAVRDERGKELTWPHDISLWWTKHLGRVRASHYCINSDNIKDFFSTPIYHWKASAARPRPLNEAAFYRDGACVGQGSQGLIAMLDEVQERRKSDTPLILAPRFKGGLDEGTTDQVWGWMAEAGISSRYEGKVWPGEAVDFARMMDDP